jgi:hypothetical protein
MNKRKITRKASDNQYLHKDFHIAFNYCLDYLQKNLGEGAVREYLAQFTLTYFSPLKQSILTSGLLALKEHYEKIYKVENAEYRMQFSEVELIIHLFASPAVMHIKNKGHSVSPLFYESVSTVNKVICQDTPYDSEVLAYQEENGAYCLRFFRRQE